MKRDNISRKLQLCVFALAFAALVTRRPDALFNPQFFGEDGSLWYPEAYMFGWFSVLFHSQNGYFQTLPRLAASLALLAPLRFAPLVMNLMGLSLQVLPANLLLSSRCRDWGPLWLRVLLGLVYLALPNSSEVHAAIEEGQWHLALIACQVVLAAAPRSVGWKLCDVIVIPLSALSGPFGVLLLPVAGGMWWRRREPWRLGLIALVGIGAAVQLSALLQTAAGTRPHVALGATPGLFVRLIGARIVAGTLFGESWRVLRLFHLESIVESRMVLAVLALIGGGVVAYCLAVARLEIKLFVAFAFVVFLASLRNPMVSDTEPQWRVLWRMGGIRYWFFPTLGFAWTIVWCAAMAPHHLARIAGRLGLLALTLGMVADWRYPAYPDFHFPDHARRFEAAPPGTFLMIPIYPPGWMMRITKTAPGCRTLPFGYLDQPPEHTTVSGLTVVGGWVIAYAPVRQVSIHVDGRSMQSIALNVPRPDVDAFYPQTPVPVKGFAAPIDFSNLPPGPHMLEARAVQINGCDAAFSTSVIETAARR